MGDPYLGEIKVVSWNYNIQGWAKCNGQLLPINQNQALFSLLGTMYGGNGQTNFALPDLRDKVAVHFGGGFNLGQTGGELAHTLTINEMPAHNHGMNAVAPNDSLNNTNIATNNFFSNSAPAELYSSSTAGGFLSPLAQTISNTGGSQPHENKQPFLALNFIIALIGIFPTHS